MRYKNPFNQTSYNEMMKLLNSPEVAEEEQFWLLDTYIQMVLDQALLAHQITLLKEQIDNALELRDKPLFLELSVEYVELRQKLQSLFETNIGI